MKITEHDLKKSQFSHFLGKIITIQTTASAMTYDDTEHGVFRHFQVFGGLCEGFDEYGVWLRHTDGPTKAFFFYNQIIGITEERPLPDDDPLVLKAMAKMQRTDDVLPPDVDYSGMSIEAFNKLVNS